MVGRGDDEDEWKRQRREPHLPLDAVDAAVQELVRDEAREGGQQQRVDEAVAGASPEDFEGEVDAVRASCRVLGVEDVEDEEGREREA